ncbi:AT-rich interactive domain-containing protein 2 isoform X2 [Diabrotica virgifera virgifera]|uniref:AT-rich interactive domain-containing protein 2 n=1 Tax=Diabrotica virgifera virgifera TaxID=50390 RepID=A0ABM5L6S2_DIAVI|nr:AT-rich interactive domain-containing protein 2 isoform X2 [Diabrotica virgifera virgifera]
MANFLGKDQATYAKEREVFLRDLQHFHEIRGTPFKRAPTLGGKEVDLYLLYTLVTSQGGWLRINSKNTWSELLPVFKLSASCVNGSIALKQIYLRYLDRWEKVHFLHEDADRTSDDDEESRHKRWSARTLHSVPCNYNYAQHIVADANREHNHLSTNLYKQSDYDRLSLSLISPLPNEQDFAINVCTLLSNDGKHTLKLEKHPRLINQLLGHAGVFNHSSTRQLFTHFYNVIRKKPIHNFWKDVLESQEYLDLTNETKFKAAETEVPSKSEPLIAGQEEEIAAIIDLNISGQSDELSEENADSVDCEIIEENCDSFKLKLTPDDSDLFCLKRSLGTQDYVGQRVLQIATILRNLSFIEENVPILVKNTSFIRFLLLCSISRWNVLSNLGMDMLCNISSEFIIRDLQSDLLATKLLKVVNHGLKSEDRAACLTSLEVLNKLSQNEQNEDVMQRLLQKHVYKHVCSFLTLHDVMLLIYTLECLYSLSSLGEKSCNYIIINHGVIDTLVSLITVEGKSYGPKACIGMKLVETLPSGSAQQTQAPTPVQTPPSSQNQSVSVTSTTVTVVSTSSSMLTSINPINTITPVTTSITTPIVNSSPTPKSAPSTPVRQVPIVPQRLMPINPPPVTTTAAPISSVIHSTSTSMSPLQMIQQQHAHQQAIQENEQFALAWLRATYEPCVAGKVDHQELYRHYLNSCSAIGRKGVISPLHFPRCVRSIFGGTVGPNPMKPTNASDPQYYDGIKVRDKPLIINLPPSSVPQTKIVTIPTPTKTPLVRRKSSVQPVQVAPAQGQANTLTVIADNNLAAEAGMASSPASPILKAQLSAPPKQKDSSPVSNKGDMKSQAMAHPHLSQALLGATAASTSTATTTITVSSGGSSKENQTMSTSTAAGQTSNTSLIKSLLATKVNDCMSTVSMRTATDCQNVAQVAARQQRLLAQQGQHMLDKTSMKESPKNVRLNGVRQLFTDAEIGDPSVSSTTQFTDLTKGKKEPPQPPPPPLAPLSNNLKGGRSQRIDNEDSDSLGNHSLASSSGIGTVGIGGVSSTEDGDNSLTSFEGLLNGVPNLDNPANDDSNSKDSVRNVASEISINKPLRLADLLEKKFEKSPPLLNGTMGKDLRLGDRSMDLVENHIEKALSRDKEPHTEKPQKMEIVEVKDEPLRDMLYQAGLKRSASEEMMEIEAKRPLLVSNVNGSTADSPAPDSSSSNGDDGPSTVSTAAAKLFADIAADILEDEDEEQLLQEAAQPSHPPQIVAEQQMQIQGHNPLQQIIVDNSQQVLLAQQRQIIVSQAQLPTTNQMVFSTGATHLKTQSGQTVIVQNTSGQRPMMLAGQNAGQILLSQGLQGQMQLVASSQPGQYVIQTSSGSGQGAAYVVAPPQNAMVHGGQQQTVLLAQTSQQQGTGAKTIIILQQQPPSGSATQHQKVVVTPQGQQVVVTQVPRPVMHTSSVSNNVSPVTKVIKTMASNNNSTTTISAQQSTHHSSPNVNIIMSDKKEDIKKHKIARDLTTPYICDWADCYVERRFRSANEVYLHACEAHCPLGSEEMICQWDRCDNMKRKRFSLMTHLHDKHCNTEAMKQSLLKRKQAAHSKHVETAPPSSTSPHPGYAPDAALHAIKRHALEFVNPKELQLKSSIPVTSGLTAVVTRGGPQLTSDQDDNEGPVTKSIRLTASLILRNLVIYSSQCKRYLKSYESHLANVALSNVESSRTIAQILFDMNDGSTHR